MRHLPTQLHRLLYVALTASALLLALPASASSLDDAKAAGHLGEQADGYVGLPPGAPNSAKTLADEVNGKRSKRYAQIATKRDTSPAAVAALAGKKLVDRAPAGQWVQNAAGKWVKK